MEQAQKDKRDAERQLRSATKEVERLQDAIKNHEEKVSNQGFWSGLLNKGQNSTHSKELEQEHKTATENKDVAQNDYDEKDAHVLKLENELQDVQNAYTNSPLGRELKRQIDLKAERQRQEAERLQREQEEQRQKEELERKEQEAQQQQVEETPKAEDVPQQYQAPTRRMRF